MVNSFDDSLLFATGFEASVKGYHDGKVRRVDYGRSDSHYIERHENIHDRILFQTADGLLHVTALWLSCNDRYPLSESGRERLAALVPALTEDSRWAHECAATYLGIKDCFSDQTREVAFAEMSDAYCRYYAVMRDAIDPEARSLVTQFAIGWAITYFAFSSQRVMRAQDWERLTWQQLELIPGPDRRLEAAIATIRRKPGFITDLIADAQSKLVAYGFDWASLDDDDVWCIKAAEDGHERSAVDNFLIRFALTQIARETGMDIVQPEFRDLPALRQPLRLLEIRQHPRANIDADFTGPTSVDEIIDMAAAGDRQQRVGRHVPLGRFDKFSCDRIFELKDFKDRVFTLAGFKESARKERICLLCYHRNDEYGDLDPDLSGIITRDLLPRLFSNLLAKMMRDQLSRPILVVENNVSMTPSSTRSWLLGEQKLDHFAVRPWQAAQRTATNSLPITPCLSVFRYCVDDWTTTLLRASGRIAEISSAPTWQGFRKTEFGYESVPGTILDPIDKEFYATLLYDDHRNITYFRMTEHETSKLYRPLIALLEYNGKVKREISCDARADEASWVRYALFSARDTQPLL